MEASPEEAPLPDPGAKAKDLRKLIKEGSVEFETENLGATRGRIYAAVERHSGYVAFDQAYSSAGRKTNTVVVRVPAPDFESFLRDATEGVEEFEQKEIEVKDVTEEFLDVSARLKTKKELEQRYLELLDRAATVTEVLEIEKELGALREEIESVEGRLNYLQDRISLSTLTLTFYEVIAEGGAFGERVGKGLENGWSLLIWFFIGLVNLWPFLLIGLIGLLGIRWYRRRKQ